MESSHSSADDAMLSADAAVRDLCMRLFREPQRLIKAHTFPVRKPRQASVKPHAHDDILQFDLAVGCIGHWKADGHDRVVEGETSTVFYPHQLHNYNVSSGREGSRVLSIKIHIENDWPAVRQRVFAAHYPALPFGEVLIRAWDRLIRLSAWSALHPPLARESLLVTRLCEVLCLWPLESGSLTTGINSLDEVVEKALHLIESHVQHPLNLHELAAAVHLSPRQLSRRFLVATGQTPQQHTDALRVTVARDLLQEHISVSEVARDLGFSSIQAFSRWFKTQNGSAPRGTWHS